MREILFRGKRTDNGEWAEGLPCYGIDGQISEIQTFHGFCSCTITEVISETVGQYTGLTDKSGTKIFEGDIVMGKLFHSTKGVVRWASEMFKVGAMSMCTYRGLMEVIGNIHDNPELLEGNNAEKL